MRTSPINLLAKEKLQELLDTSNSVCDVLRYFGLNPVSGNHRTLHVRVIRDGLDLAKLKSNRDDLQKSRAKAFGKLIQIPLAKLLVEHSTGNRGELKRRLITEGLLANCCKDCGNKGVWNDKPLVLQLEHNNGVSDDNRLENLSLLCPNCHTQTATYAGRNAKRPVKPKSHSKPRPRKLKVSKEELETLIKANPIIKVGAMFGVSDNAVRKRCRLLGIALNLCPYSHRNTIS